MYKKKKENKPFKNSEGQHSLPLTIIFQTAWHFASASGLQFSHDDQNYVQSQWNLHIKHKPSLVQPDTRSAVSVKLRRQRIVWFAPNSTSFVHPHLLLTYIYLLILDPPLISCMRRRWMLYHWTIAAVSYIWPHSFHRRWQMHVKWRIYCV